MGWVSYLEDIEKLRDNLGHLGEQIRATSAANQAKSPRITTAGKRNRSGSTQESDGLRATLASAAISLKDLEKRLNVLLDTATDPAIALVVEAEKKLAADEKAKEVTKTIARKALAKSRRRRDVAAGLEHEVANLKRENFALSAELAKLTVSGATNPNERENTKLKGRIRELQDLLGKRAGDTRGK